MLLKIVKRQDADTSQLEAYISDPIMRQLLARRGIFRPEDLDSSLKGLLHYNQLQDIFVAADEIARAIMGRARIMIAGDYDIDGMSGTALGVRCLKAFGLPESHIFYYVPSRYEDGYGLSKKAVDYAEINSVNLIVTVDNGVAAFESVDYAVSKGIRVVVTDHHEIQDRLPNAIAIVDPKRKDDNFASKNLCGVGVLFYVMTAVRARLLDYQYFSSPQSMPNMAQFLDLVTLGTIGDVMALDNNNRRLVKTGLKQIRASQCCKGIQELTKALELNPSKIDTRSIGFDFCPHFNAATRIKIDSNPAIKNLLTDDPEEAQQTAMMLKMCNKRRTDYEKVMLAQALVQLELIYGKPVSSSNGAAPKTKKAAKGPHVTAQGAPVDMADMMGIERGPVVNPNSTEAAEAAAEALANQEISVPRAMIEERVSFLIDNESASISEDSPEISKFAGIVLFEPTFLTGLVGLVANRIKERYSKPCVIFGADVGTGEMGISDNFVKLQHQQAHVPYHSQMQGTPYAMSGVPQGTFQGAPLVAPQVTPQGAPQNATGASLSPVDLDDVYTDIEKEFADPRCMHTIVGSARSVEGIDLMEVFSYMKQRAPDLFVACGGHAIAAGASIPAKHLHLFRRLFDEACRACDKNAGGNHESAVVTDGALPPSHLCLTFAKDLEMFGPWGKEFEEPKFDGIFILESGQLLKERHLKMRLRTENQLLVVEAIKFRANAKEKQLLGLGRARVKVIYTLSINRYYQERLQLNVEAIELADLRDVEQYVC